MKPIGIIRTDFKDKFGIPRQSGLVGELRGTVVFEPEYRNPDALKGLEGFSHIWLIWLFSKVEYSEFKATVRPPRLGGNRRVGVFATRSPYRPNRIGMSLVRLEKIEKTENNGAVIRVLGADMLDKTPILDIKPYLPFTEAVPDAAGGFAELSSGYSLEVEFPEKLLEAVPVEHRSALIKILAGDPRPAYHTDSRHYHTVYAGYEVRFSVEPSGHRLIVDEVKKCGN